MNLQNKYDLDNEEVEKRWKIAIRIYVIALIIFIGIQVLLKLQIL